MIKTILKSLLFFCFSFLLLFNIYVIITGKYFIYKALAYNFVGIDDYKIFDNRIIKASPKVEQWNISTNYNTFSLPDTIEKTHQNLASIAFLIIKNDSICYEKYYNGYADTSHTNSFSMAKSVVSMLVGVAIREGKIKSVNDYVSTYLPQFAEGEKAKITIKDLLMMSSGLDWDESKSYNNLVKVFFSDIMEAYYGNNLYELCMKTNAVSASGVFFDYKSGDTQLLSFILQKATGMSLSKYFEQKLWQPMGASQDAYWSLDKADGQEKAFCCINSNARDYARLGKIMLQKGNWNGKQIIDSSYIAAATTPKWLISPEKNEVNYYGFQFWLLPQFKDEGIYYFRGTLGQLIVVLPKKNMLVVRLGTMEGAKQNDHYSQAILYAEMARNM